MENERTDFSCAAAYMIKDGEKVAIVLPKPETFFMRMPFCHKSMFTRRDLLIRENGFDSVNFKSAADYDLIVRLILKGYKVSIIENIIVSFRANGFSEKNGRLSKSERQKIWNKYIPEAMHWYGKTKKQSRVCDCRFNIFFICQYEKK